MAMQNKQKAVEIAMECEKKQGRNPETTNKFKQGYDIKSDDRLISIKISEKKNADLLISFKNFKKLGRDINKYYIYLFYDMEGKPKFKILSPEVILRNFNLLTLINIKSRIISSIKNEEL